MSDAKPPRSFGPSIGAILAGFFAVAILSIATDLVLHLAHILPPLGEVTSGPLLLLATAYRTLYGVAGGYLTARLAPDRPMAHALVLGIVGLILCIVGAAVTWNKGPAFGPHWYPLALVVLAIPQTLAGGAIFLSQSRTR
jgi:hypothetical protein